MPLFGRYRLDTLFRLIVKELYSIKADPVMLVLVVYAFTIAIYLVSTGVTTEIKNLPVAVVDEDRSTLSRQIADAISPPLFKPAVQLTAPQVDPAMNAGTYVFVVQIPPNFQADLTAAKPATILVEVDATAMAQAGNGSAYLQQVISNEVETFLQGRLGAAAPDIDFVMRTRFNPNLDPVWFSAVMQVMNNIALLTLILSGAALIREREHGTVEHLLVMPVTPGEITLSKIIANGMVIVVAAGISLIVVVHWMLGVPMLGSLGLFLFGTAIYTLSIASLGILLGTFATSMGQFGLLAIPTLVVLMLLSGGMTPMESMPAWLQYTMKTISPSPHFVSFAQSVLYRGAGLSVVWPQLLTFLALGVVYYAISLYRFRTVLLKG
ncbi:ABC transporter permease [Rhizobiaceae bacterium n13]|uniref:ABC transporter permease n=1 Tax=Ferirhizobium litorale TaxID=2927786 RepID=A0AAE3U1S5_9HYPH|nr:ABC transporter permease [Fererhizobium litorale]MDI7861947.1 ABC transporter permease [Fererhizobium litorale]MDI7922781.1 ABC transporter permease [Fererhizobium litorale]